MLRCEWEEKNTLVTEGEHGDEIPRPKECGKCWLEEWNIMVEIKHTGARG